MPSRHSHPRRRRATARVEVARAQGDIAIRIATLSLGAILLALLLISPWAG